MEFIEYPFDNKMFEVKIKSKIKFKNRGAFIFRNLKPVTKTERSEFDPFFFYNLSIKKYNLEEIQINSLETYKGYFDGSCSGFQNKAQAGLFICDQNDKTVAKVSVYLGKNKTNNFSEAYSLFYLLKLATDLGIRNIETFGDSELIVKQFNGKYKINNFILQMIHKGRE
jgi:hypothetical protein